MTELMKRYEAETGKSSTQTITDGLDIWHYEYIAWLEAKANISDEAIKAFQELIRNQCDEISALKEQLRWRLVSEKPEKAGVYFVEAKPYTGCNSTIITTAYFDGKRFPWHDVVRWLPMPPAPEGEVK